MPRIRALLALIALISGVASVLSEGRSAGVASPAFRVLCALSTNCGANFLGLGGCFLLPRADVSTGSGLNLRGEVFSSHSSANLRRLLLLEVVVVSTGSGTKRRTFFCVFSMGSGANLRFVDCVISTGCGANRRVVLCVVSVGCGANLRFVFVVVSTGSGANLRFDFVVVSTGSGANFRLVFCVVSRGSGANLRLLLVVVSTGSGANFRTGFEVPTSESSLRSLELEVEVSIGSTLNRLGGATLAMVSLTQTPKA